jgi:hypothetical protein
VRKIALLMALSCSLASAQVITSLYQFRSVGADGAYPESGVVPDNIGNLFGTTTAGGYGYGTVYKLTKPQMVGAFWKRTVIYRFRGVQDGCNPYGGVLLTSSGVLYGTTYGCGAFAEGVVFSLTPLGTGQGWRYRVLHQFGSVTNDGSHAFASLAMDKVGVLYGTASGGGQYNWGCVFSLRQMSSENWTTTIIHSFGATSSDGNEPNSVLAVDQTGALYGTTPYGGGITTLGCGANGCGVVFKLSPPSPPSKTWTETIIHSFSGLGDGSYTFGPVLLDNAGNVYGVANQGGSCPGCGVVYQLAPPQTVDESWTENVLHDFSGSGDGAHPYGGLVFDSAGNLYGTTQGGGQGHGVVFTLTPAILGGNWSESTVDFKSNGTAGDNPLGDLTVDSSGVIYGTTVQGGYPGLGTVFSLAP